MKTIEFWNKKTPINGVEANEILKDNFFKNARSLFLIKNGDQVTNIENVDVVKTVIEMDGTDEEIAQAYLDYMEMQNNPEMQPMMLSAEPTISDLQFQLNEVNEKLDKILEILSK